MTDGYEAAGDSGVRVAELFWHAPSSLRWTTGALVVLIILSMTVTLLGAMGVV